MRIFNLISQLYKSLHIVTGYTAYIRICIQCFLAKNQGTLIWRDFLVPAVHLHLPSTQHVKLTSVESWFLFCFLVQCYSKCLVCFYRIIFYVTPELSVLMCMCVCVRACMCGYVCFFWLCRAGWLRRQQRGFEGAGSAALARGEHLAGEMVKGVVSFWGGADPSVRTCTEHKERLWHTITDFKSTAQWLVGSVWVPAVRPGVGEG